jgi:hypothetical protein
MFVANELGLLLGEVVGPLVGDRVLSIPSPIMIRKLPGPSLVVGVLVDVLQLPVSRFSRPMLYPTHVGDVGDLVGLLEGAVLDRIMGPSVLAKTGPGFPRVNETGAKAGDVGDLVGLLEGAVLDRIMGPSVLAKTGLGLSRVNEIGAKVESGGVASIEYRLARSLDVSQELSIRKTVITAAEAKITTAAMVATDTQVFPVAAVAIFTAPVVADAPVTMDAWTAIDCRVESNRNPFSFICTIFTISVGFMVATCTLQ